MTDNKKGRELELELEELVKQLPRKDIKHPDEVRFPEEAAIALTEEFSAEIWSKMDNMFYRASRDLRINVFINVIVVGVGIALLAYSMIYSWIRGLDLYSTVFGSLGVIDFIMLFYFSPQKGIAKSIGDLTQLQILYRTYIMLAEALSKWDYENPEKDLDQLERITKNLEGLTNNIVQRIQDLIGT